MFGKKRTKDDVEQYIASITFPGETIEATHIAGYDPIDFVAVTSHRFIGTEVAQSMAPIIRSVPFDRIAAISVTDNKDDLLLGSGSVDYLVVHGHGDVGRIAIQGRQEASALFSVYQALIHRVCGIDHAAPKPTG